MKIDNYRTWLKALKLIPGGNMLISKTTNNLIKKYPIYFSKCQGSYIWDSNGKNI